MDEFTKSVLVTRPKAQSEEFDSLLEAGRIRPLFFPLIEIRPPQSWDELDDAISRVGSFDGILFTSVNAVAAFFDRRELLEPDGKGGVTLPVCYAVGEKTRLAAEARGAVCAGMPERFDARHLADTVRDAAGKRFLIPQSDIGRDEISSLLQAAGATVERVTAYRTIVPGGAQISRLESMFVEGEVDCIAFFSPSAVRNFSLLIPDFKQATILVAAIGGTTATTALASGLRVDIISPEATSAAFADAIIRALQSDDRIDLDRQFISDDL